MKYQTNWVCELFHSPGRGLFHPVFLEPETWVQNQAVDGMIDPLEPVKRSEET